MTSRNEQFTAEQSRDGTDRKRVTLPSKEEIQVAEVLDRRESEVALRHGVQIAEVLFGEDLEQAIHQLVEAECVPISTSEARTQP